MARFSATTNIRDLFARLLDYYYADSQKTFLLDIARRNVLSLHDTVAAIIAANLCRDYFVFPRHSSSQIDDREFLFVDRFRADSRIFEGRFSVFLSYRRNDVIQFTNRIYDTLCQTYGETTIFRDINTMDLGFPFQKELSRVISSCRVMVVIVGKDWLASDPLTGRSRLMDEYDPIRMELLTAHENSIPIILVCMEQAPILDVYNIPDCLHFILSSDKISLETDANVDEFLEVVSSRCRHHFDDPDTAGLQLPVFSRDCLLSLQILTVAALGISRIYKLAMDDPKEVITRLTNDVASLLEYETIITQWSYFLGIERNNEKGRQVPQFVYHLSEILRVSFEEMTDDRCDEIALSLGMDEQIPQSRHSITAAAAHGLMKKEFFFIKRNAPIDIIVPKSVSSIETFIKRVFADIPSRVLLSCPDADGLSDSARLVNHLTVALEDMITIHIRGGADQVATQEFDRIGAYIIILDSSFLTELSGDSLLAFSAEVEKIVELRVPVLPILMPGASIPRQDEISPQLKKIFEFTVMNLQSGSGFATQVEDIISWVRIRCRPGIFISEACPPARIPLYGETQVRTLVLSALSLRDALLACSAACMEDASRACEVIASNLETTEKLRAVVGIYAQHLGMNIDSDTEFIGYND